MNEAGDDEGDDCGGGRAEALGQSNKHQAEDNIAKIRVPALAPKVAE